MPLVEGSPAYPSHPRRVSSSCISSWKRGEPFTIRVYASVVLNNQRMSEKCWLGQRDQFFFHKRSLNLSRPRQRGWPFYTERGLTLPNSLSDTYKPISSSSKIKLRHPLNPRYRVYGTFMLCSQGRCFSIVLHFDVSHTPVRNTLDNKASRCRI